MMKVFERLPEAGANVAGHERFDVLGRYGFLDIFRAGGHGARRRLLPGETFVPHLVVDICTVA